MLSACAAAGRTTRPPRQKTDMPSALSTANVAIHRSVDSNPGYTDQTCNDAFLVQAVCLFVYWGFRARRRQRSFCAHNCSLFYVAAGFLVYKIN